MNRRHSCLHPFTRIAWLTAAALALAGLTASAQETAGDDPHAAHRAMMAQASNGSLRVDHAAYEIPDVVLRDEQGRPVRVRELLGGDRPVAVNFIFTSCTTICPVMTATFLQLQHELAGQPSRPLFVSISIDPDFDTSVTLNAYARKFGADWTFLTGDRADVLSVLQSFAAWRGNKNNHAAITLFRGTGGGHWIRVEGLASAQQLAEVWRDQVG